MVRGVCEALLCMLGQQRVRACLLQRTGTGINRNSGLPIYSEQPHQVVARSKLV